MPERPDRHHRNPSSPAANPPSGQPVSPALAAYARAAGYGSLVRTPVPPGISAEQVRAALYGSQPPQSPAAGPASRHRRDQLSVIGPHDEVIFEHAMRGGSKLVTAMHVPSLTEVAVVGPAGAGRHDMERLALAKLDFMLRKRAERR